MIDEDVNQFQFILKELYSAMMPEFLLIIIRTHKIIHYR